jgi:prephenate dehydratase
MRTQPERPSSRPLVGYLGPEGTFTEEALLASALPEAIEPVALASIYDTVKALRDGALSWAIAPIENSLDGSISVTLDLLAGEASDVKIVGEALLRVRHSLIAAGEIELKEIETVLTHPQVPGQCTAFLRGEIPQARILSAGSTAEAVRVVCASATPGRAALGTLLAASIYGGTVIREGVEDRDDNETRFVWLARAQDATVTAPLRRQADIKEWKTSLMFWGLGAERPGWLLRCLEEFAGRGINLMKIESRPLRERMGSYMFFVDGAGRASEQPLADAIAGLGGLCEEVRVLGSYPVAAPARGQAAQG